MDQSKNIHIYNDIKRLTYVRIENILNENIYAFQTHQSPVLSSPS